MRPASILRHRQLPDSYLWRIFIKKRWEGKIYTYTIFTQIQCFIKFRFRNPVEEFVYKIGSKVSEFIILDFTMVSTLSIFVNTFLHFTRDKFISVNIMLNYQYNAYNAIALNRLHGKL